MSIISSRKYELRKPTQTNIISLDMVLGGGYKPGQVIELASPSGFGKSTLMLYLCKLLVDQGQSVIYLDVEAGVEEEILENLGLIDYLGEEFKLIRIHTFKDLEDVLDDIFKAKQEETKDSKKKDDLNLDAISHVFIDSITQLCPGRVAAMSIDDIVKNPAIQARYNSAFFNKYKPEFSFNGVTLWLINQVRKNIGGFFKVTNESTGGNAVEFYPDKRIKLKKCTKWYKEVETAFGTQKVPEGGVVQMVAEKNRTEAAGIPVELPIIFGRGISNILTVQSLLTSRGVISGGGGGNYTVSLFDEPVKIKGKDKIYPWIAENYDDIIEAMDTHNLFTLVGSSSEEEIENNINNAVNAGEEDS